jgi:hypothetical protein
VFALATEDHTKTIPSSNKSNYMLEKKNITCSKGVALLPGSLLPTRNFQIKEAETLIYQRRLKTRLNAPASSQEDSET